MPNNKKDESEFANSDISRTAQHNLLSDIRPRKSIKELQQDSSLMSEVDEIQNESQMSADKIENEFTKIKSKPKPVLPVHVDGTTEHGSTKPFVTLALIFTAAVFVLGSVYLSFPALDESEKEYFGLPRNIDDAKNLGKVLSRYKDTNYAQVLTGYFTAYIFLQSFAIPGSIFLSILSGFLFSFPLALFLVCLCSALGATICYLLSYLVATRLVQKYLPERAAEWSLQVQKHKDHLLNYIIFLRVTPFLPNWFINIVSPVIDVPIWPFFLGTFLGVAPPSVVYIQAGQTLNKLTSSTDALSWSSVFFLMFFAVVSLVPVIYKKRLQARFEETKEK